MAKATVLVVDREETRRREIVRTLASLGYDVVAAATAEEGRRFEVGLAPDVVIAEAGLTPAGAQAAGRPLRIVLASESDDGGRHTAAVVPAGLAPVAVLERVRTALVAHEAGLAPEPGLGALAGTVQALPVLELIPRLAPAGGPGRVAFEDGEIALDGGEVVRCAAGHARGEKAFARLARRGSGAYRIVLGEVAGEREIRSDVLSLMALAMEDGPRFDEAADRLPDLASRMRLVIGPTFFATQFSPIQQRLLTEAPSGESVWDVLDQIPEPDGSVLEEVARLAELGFIAFDPPEVKVRIVTDSTADLPPALAERLGVVVVPASLIVDGKILKDGVDVTAAEFFAMVGHGRSRAVESQPPTRGEFLAAYRAAVARKDVVSVHASARLSDALGRARAAAEEGGDDFRRLRGGGAPEVEVVDSALATTPLALLVTIGARLAARRLAAREIRVRLDGMAPRFHVLFAVEHPDFIVRSAAATGVSGFLGSLLGMRPILALRDGAIEAVERVRGEGNVAARLVELLRAAVDPARPVLAGIGHAAAPQAAIRLRSLLHDGLEVAELLENEIGAAVGLHVGPGCVAVAVFQPTAEELELIGVR